MGRDAESWLFGRTSDVGDEGKRGGFGKFYTLIEEREGEGQINALQYVFDMVAVKGVTYPFASIDACFSF